MQSADIRRSFVEFFKSKAHQHVASSSLVPADDPTLLFTNAGMVQFKRTFQGLEQRDYRRAVTVQKCVRAGGKHNDLEQVGHTARHHTFFEMLGNFSFGDYFKREAIAFAWEWVTGARYLGLDPSRLYVSVHHSDDEARRLWREAAGVPNDRIYGLSDNDNFWQMGETGPCGPCSEIFVDLREKGERGTRNGSLTLDEFVALNDADKVVEIWNLVFMQFDQAADGSRSKLPAPSVDTGAGLERITAVLNGADSSFHTDVFAPIIGKAEEILQRPYDRGPDGAPFRVLADHARAVAFLLADEVYPSNEGRGYVLRRILRRAVRHAWLLGRKDPTLVHLTRVVVERMGDFYPELAKREAHIASVTQAEEERFLETIDGGLERLDELTARGSGAISGDEAFKLYDTYGFPVDLTQIIAGERGMTVDVTAFEAAMTRQQERSRQAGKAERGARGGEPRAQVVHATPDGDWVRVGKSRKRQRFVGYEATRAETEVLAYRHAGEQLELVLHENPFYAESGGQVSDTGVVKGRGWELPVDDVRKVDGQQVVSGPFPGEFEPTGADAIVAGERRRNIERNHTATHLVHAALRNVLGTHVHQAGSVVAPERLRFDFSHHGPVNDEQLAAIEQEVNRGIWANLGITTYQLPYKDAVKKGAMALFGEKYGDIVRVVDVPGVSLELCGGTHVRSTGEIGLFHFTHESGVAAGVRRIEAVTGPGVYAVLRELDTRLSEAADALRTAPDQLARRIDTLLEEKKRLEKQVEELLKGGTGKGEGGTVLRVGEVELAVEESTLTDRTQIGLLMDAFRGKNRSAVKVLVSGGERPSLHVAVTDDLIARGVKAGDLVGRIAAVSGGKGGGRPQFASAGVGDPAKLGETLASIEGIVRAALGGGTSS